MSSRYFSPLLLRCLLYLFLLCGGHAVWAAPANDDWANAQPISGSSGAVNATTTGASVESGEPLDVVGEYCNSVWFSWVAPSTGRYRFADMINNGSGNTVQLFRGSSLATLTQCPHSESYGIRYFTHVLQAEAGVQYWVRFRNRNTAFNQYGVSTTIVWGLETRPDNDDFVNATAIGGSTSGAAAVDFTNATLEDFERSYQDLASYPSVWYKWTAPARGRYRFSISNGMPSYEVVVFYGSNPASLVPIYKGNLNTDYFYYLDVGAHAGDTFYVAATLHEGNFGLTGKSILWNFNAAPANDDFADAQNLGSAASGSATYSTQYATGEALEPTINAPTTYGNAVPSNAQSVWFKWTAPTTTRMQWAGVNAAYSGASLATLGANLMNTDKRFNAVAGTTYYLSAISGTSLTYAAATGPANDDFLEAVPISGERAPVLAASPSGRGVAGTNVGASKQIGEPYYRSETANTRSVWYSWTAPSTGRFEFFARGAGGSFRVAATSGNDVANLTPVSVQLVTNGPVRFDAIAGAVYNIAVLDEYGSGGTFYLDWNPTSKPANDNYADAQDLGNASSGSVSGSNVGSTSESLYDGSGSGSYKQSVWYKWTAPASKRYRFWISDSTNHGCDFTLGYTPPYLVTAINDWNGRTNVTQGKLYYIRVGTTTASTEGTFTLNWAEAPPPANYLKTTATVISGESGSVVSTNVNATGTDAEVWYSWTAPKSGPFKFFMAGSPFESRNFDFQVQNTSGTVLASGYFVGGSTPSSYQVAAFGAVSGTTYLIRVSGRSVTSVGDTHPYEGNFDLRWRGAPAPPNDNFAGATLLEGTSGSIVGTTLDATTESGEPSTSGVSVWYKFVPPSTGRYTMNLDVPTTGTQKFTRTLYSGSSVGALTQNYPDSIARYKLVAGTAYYIAVTGNTEDTDTFTLRWAFTPIPPNDDFVNAQILPATAPALATSASGNGVQGTTIGASDETYASSTNSNVWYKWTAPATARYRFQLVGLKSGTTTVAPVGTITVTTGTTVTSLTQVATASGASQARFDATAGTTYNISVTTQMASEHDFVFDWASLIPPPNDNFINAQALTGENGTVNGTTNGASKESGESSANSSSSVWYVWTAPATARFRISLPTVSGTAAYYQLNVFTGSAVNALTKVDDAKHAFSATLGTTYYFAVAVLGTDYEGTFTFDWRRVVPPFNDDFVNAYNLPPDASGERDDTTLYATIESGEPRAASSGSSGPGVWYRFTPAISGTYRFRITGTDTTNTARQYSFAIGAFTGSPVSNLTRIPATSAYAYSPTFTILGVDYTMGLTAGTTYSLEVDSTYSNYYGDGPFHFEWTRTNPPPNDNFVNAQLITGASGEVSGTTTNGTPETGEPSHGGSGPTRSIWYSWTAPSSGTIGFDATLFDATHTDLGGSVAAYTGTSVSALTPVTQAASGGFDIAWNAVAGTTYYIAVDGASANVKLKWSSLAGPPNDDFANAILLSSSSGTKNGIVLRATQQSGEAASSGYPNVWYKWVGGSEKRLRVSVTAPYETHVGVFTGSSLETLTKVSDARDRFAVTAGTTYYIAVFSPLPGQSDEFTLTWAPTTPPVNDNFADAQVISGLKAPLYATSSTGYGVPGRTLDATRETGEPQLGLATVWYDWTCPGSGTYTFGIVKGTVNDTQQNHTIGDFILSNHKLAVYAGGTSSAETATLVATGDLGKPLVFRASKGMNYRITVGANFTNNALYEDYFLLDWNRTESGPANDDLSGETTLSGQTGTVSGTNVNAGEEQGETTPGGASVWYRWTPPITGPVTFDTLGSALDTVLTAYEGINLNFRDLKIVKTNDDIDSAQKSSRITFDAVKDRVYHIAVSGHGEPVAAMGTFKLNWSQTEIAALKLALTKTVIAENAGANAATLTISRTGSTVTQLRVALKITTTDNLAPRFTIPAFANILAGQSSVKVQLDALDDTFAFGTQNASIIASAPPLVGATQALQITDNDRATLTLTPSAAPYLEGSTVRFTISRNTPTTAALTVTLGATPSGIVTLPTTVVIPAGKSSVVFDARAIDDGLALGNKAVTVSAKAGTLSATSKITFTDAQKPTLKLSVSPTSIAENATTTLTATLSRNTATTTVLTVKLISSDSGEARVPARVVIPAGKNSVTFAVSPVDDAFDDGTQSVTISATATGFASPATAVINVTDNEAATLTLSVFPNRFKENASTTATLSRNAEIKTTTPALTVTLASSLSGQLELPTTVQIPVGKASATFTIKGVNNTLADGPRVLTLSASATGYVKAATNITLLDDEPASSGRLGGRITLNGSPLTGVQLTLKNGTRILDEQTSSGTGDYTFSGLPAGTYFITPTSATFTFDPTSRTATLTTTVGSVEALNFVAKSLTGLRATSTLNSSNTSSPVVSITEPSSEAYSATTLQNLNIAGTVSDASPNGCVLVALAKFGDQSSVVPSGYWDWNEGQFLLAPENDSMNLQVNGFMNWKLDSNRVLSQLAPGFYGVRVVALDSEGSTSAPVWKHFLVSRSSSAPTS